MRRLEGKRCLITGGSRGFGLAIAKACARHGARVAFTFSTNTDDASAARASLGELGAVPLVFQGSVAEAAHVEATVTDVIAAWGGIDVLVNNAGIMQVLPIALLEEHDWDRMMSINLRGAFLFSRAVLRSMIRARAGHILNIGSCTSERVIDAPLHYAAAKSALRGMTEALACEVGRYNVKVNLLAPGPLDVGISQMLPAHHIREYAARTPAGRLVDANAVAELATFLVSDDNSFMTAAKIVADGGFL